MKAVVIPEKDGEFTLVDLPVPSPKEDEILIKIESTTINPSDILLSIGAFGELKYPAQIGLEGFGTVVKSGGPKGENFVGKKVSFWSLNTRSWAEYATVPVIDSMIMDEKTKPENGSNAYLNPLTCMGLMQKVLDGKHKAAIISAASSHCGKILLQLCKEHGLKTIAVVRRDDQIEHIKPYGPDVVLNSNDSDFDAKLQTITQELNATCLIDCINGSFTARVLKAMPMFSHAYLYGLLSGESTIPIDAMGFFVRGQLLGSFFISNYVSNLSDQEREQVHRKVQSFISHFESPPSKVLNLKDIKEAVEYYKSNASKGKVVLLV